MNRIEIANKITSAEKNTVALLASCTTQYVGMVLRGERESEEILLIASRLVESREKTIEALITELAIELSSPPKPSN